MNEEKTIRYADSIFRTSFNLYGYDDINFEESKEEILQNFERQKGAIIKEKLDVIGLKFIGLKYYSPKAYNFEGDSMDLLVEVVDKNKLKNSILSNKDRIDKELQDNKSYDGYMALTVSSVNEELTNLEKEDYEPDIIVLAVLLDFDFEDTFDLNESLIFEDAEDGN